MAKRAKKKPARTRNPRSDVYQIAEAEWKRLKAARDPDLGSGNYMVDAPEVVDPFKVTATLRLLERLTGNRAYWDCCNFIISELVDPKTNNWLGYRLGHRDPRSLAVEAIEDVIAAGMMKERAAIARFIIEFKIDAANFGAAHKRIYRLLREYRKKNPS
jgi:hypothetical protein